MGVLETDRQAAQQEQVMKIPFEMMIYLFKQTFHFKMTNSDTGVFAKLWAGGGREERNDERRGADTGRNGDVGTRNGQEGTAGEGTLFECKIHHF